MCVSCVNQTPILFFSVQNIHYSPCVCFISGVEVKSSKTQTKETSSKPITHIPVSTTNQYFFDPYPASSTSPLHPQPSSLPTTTTHAPPAHTHIPSVGPTHGQLIPMAIPLGEPRTGGGLPHPVSMTTSRRDEEGEDDSGMPHPVHGSTPRHQKTTNVAVVNVVAAERKPNLQVQVSRIRMLMKRLQSTKTSRECWHYIVRILCNLKRNVQKRVSYVFTLY